jgi:uncharacterized phage-associated protein
MHSARAVANSFLRITKDLGKPLTNMQLQKLVYFAHGWHLALSGKPLLTDAVKAWDFGPVIPPLYNRLKQYGNGVVTDFIKRRDPETGEIQVVEEEETEFVRKLLRRVWEVYGHMSGSQMSYLSHQPGTPWEITWNKQKYVVIPNDLIKVHFLSLKGDKDAKYRSGH